MMQRIIDGDEGASSIIVLVIILLLLPLFLYEGFVLRNTAEKIDVDDVYVDEYRTEADEETENITKIEMDLNIDIKNSASTRVKIHKVEYDLTIETEDYGQEDVEFDSGEVYRKTIKGGGITTISMPIENNDEDKVEKIQDYIFEEKGEIDAVANIHIPLLQILVDYPITTISEELRESFEYEPVLDDYEINDENATLENANETEEGDHVLKIPYEIETNDNEFLSGNAVIETTMETDDGEITSSDSIKLEINDKRRVGNFRFGLYEDDTEGLMTNDQNILIYSDISLGENISFQRDHPDIHSPPVLVEYSINGDEARLNETSDPPTLEVPYYIETDEGAFFEEGGDVAVTTTMESEDGTVTSSTSFEIEVGETEEGNLTFELTEEEAIELKNEDKTLLFTSDIERDEVSFEYEHGESEWIAPTFPLGRAGK